MDAQYWDEKYRSRDRLFSGDPNGVLVTEVSDLPPGQALDVGCGEGGDAIWLARRGWRVTGVDLSRTALERAATAAADLADRVAWQCGDLTTAPPPANAFDLVNVQYFPLPRQAGHAGLRGLLDAVAPGGTLLFVGHDPDDQPSNHEHRVADFYLPSEVAALLDDAWTILVDQKRPRTAPAPEGTPHTRDTVLSARRLG